VVGYLWMTLPRIACLVWAYVGNGLVYTFDPTQTGSKGVGVLRLPLDDDCDRCCYFIPVLALRLSCWSYGCTSWTGTKAERLKTKKSLLGTFKLWSFMFSILMGFHFQMLWISNFISLLAERNKLAGSNHWEVTIYLKSQRATPSSAFPLGRQKRKGLSPATAAVA